MCDRVEHVQQTQQAIHIHVLRITILYYISCLTSFTIHTLHRI